MGGINFRKMKQEDICKLAEMFVNQGWDAREDVLKKYWEEQVLGARIVLVAEIPTELAGYVTLIKVASHGPFANLYPEVADFNVFKKYQKLGIGNKLLENIEQKAKNFSNIITLGVGMHSGYGAAQRMYVKRGYIPDGTGLWFNNKNLAEDEPCLNNDDLVIYLSKSI
ncbi:GNAT family N-acetyltransferase [Enterococcus nangangensis]|uniref:GNAT family N-acetyltransferase n=1 Tax=Enterococcus nangangensis TaxID=2559926 RepID=UPI0010F5FF2E|nr:GNAT family N-acetyltransferase [Enterococcus nangangensis]